ncbi:hypothetical protein KAM344_14160 [Aeromonas caviae]|nr:hypothetical protein KAM360_11900 [Aeromonas caviae]GKQ66251.1 hypothetical protein KAM344_14160 [Aeromonas caviae]
MIVEVAGQLGEAGGQILHADAGDLGRRRDEFPILLKQHGGRSLSHRLFDETPAIHLMASDRHEERAGTDPPAVELEVGEGKRRGSDAEAAHQLIK